ncbi:MAG: FAD-binding oxidoreductase, partial [Chitinispirillaceae bacterium]|nr:FAD-binding oxidoreductase [Chitinispirillaceae bacterium]
MFEEIASKTFASLREIVGDTFVVKGPIATFAYKHDASMFDGTDALFVVRPCSTEEVSRVMATANEQAIPVVIRGGGASIFGQPKGKPGCNILLDMTRMNQVLAIDPINRTVTAQAGIIMSKLQHACSNAGFFKRLPLPPIHIATLGGWLSAAGGGGGLMLDTVGLTVVLPDGSIVQTGGGPGTNSNQPCPFNRYLGGPDLTSLF